jgi:hypothetical protein
MSYIQPIPDLLAYDPMKHNDSLIGKSFLTPAGSLLVVGSAGVGKSKYVQHLACSMALGRDFLGMRIHRKLRVLYVQAEDVIDDLAESLQGFVKHTAGGDPKAVKDLIANLTMATVVGPTGEDFIGLIEAMCDTHHPHVVVIDPLLAFMGCDLVDQGAITQFLRVRLAQLARKRNCGLICAHHARKDKGTGSTIERAFGGMEFSAFFRGIIDLSSDPKDYRQVTMKVVKRQRQLGLTDAAGRSIDTVNLKMGHDAVYWTVNAQWTPADLEPKGGRPPKTAKAAVDETVAAAKAAGMTESKVIETVAEKHGYSKKQAGRLVKATKA